MILESKRKLGIVIVSGLILLIPLVAMQFTEEVSWSLSDFVIAAVLLLGTGFGLDIVLTRISSMKYRIALAAMVLVTFVLVWLELAVGVFGTVFSGS